MPGMNGMGPAGAGPGTGKGAGLCTGSRAPEFFRGGNYGRGHCGGRRRLRGEGRFRGWDFPGNQGDAVIMTAEEEQLALKNQAQWLLENLESTKKRIKDLEKKGPEKA